MKPVLMTVKANEEWRDAVNDFAAGLGVSSSTLIGESVRLLALLKGVELPERVGAVSVQQPGIKFQSLDFSTLDVERLKN